MRRKKKLSGIRSSVENSRIKGIVDTEKRTGPSRVIAVCK